MLSWWSFIALTNFGYFFPFDRLSYVFAVDWNFVLPKLYSIGCMFDFFQFGLNFIFLNIWYTSQNHNTFHLFRYFG